jgi:hypothetical protein
MVHCNYMQHVWCSVSSLFFRVCRDQTNAMPTTLLLLSCLFSVHFPNETHYLRDYVVELYVEHVILLLLDTYYVVLRTSGVNLAVRVQHD